MAEQKLNEKRGGNVLSSLQLELDELDQKKQSAGGEATSYKLAAAEEEGNMVLSFQLKDENECPTLCPLWLKNF